MKHESFRNEIRAFKDPLTGRAIRQLTAGSGDEYHIYYQAYPVTADGKWLVFYSQRDGRTDLYRLGLFDGVITRLTRGRTANSGWWPFSPLRSEGVYDFIACLHPETGRVFYHDQNEIRVIDIESLEDTLISLGSEDMRPLSQMACSFDGTFITTVWTPKEHIEEADRARIEAEKAALEKGDNELHGRMIKGFDEGEWMMRLKSRLDVIDTVSGKADTLIDRSFPLHNMVICSDNRQVVVVESP